MTRKDFERPMSGPEKVAGWIYVPIHIFALPILLPSAALMLNSVGISLTDIQINFIYYLLGFLFSALIMGHYLKNTFNDFADSVLRTLLNVVVCLVVYYCIAYVVNFVLAFFLPDLINPNTGAVIENTMENSKSMFAVSVLLAPITEEVIFRGVVFGTVRRKNRIAAFVISALIFSVYHLWQFAVIGYSIGTLVLYAIQYIPASIMLAKCMEDSGNLWGPIFMHMTVNYLALLVTKLM